MINKKQIRLAGLTGTALLSGLAAATEAQAGSFGVREQSAVFQGSAYAGEAAGGDISSMFWNSAATAALPGFNDSENLTGVFGHAKETATDGLFVTGLVPNSAEVGQDSILASSYTTYQVNDRLWLGVGLNAPYGFITKPDTNWAGSAFGTTTKVFSLDANPTVAYKLTPTLTIGAGVQVEYFEVRLNHSDFAVPVVGDISPSRSVKADDWGVGGTAGVLWDPIPGTTLGLGYRSEVGVDVSGAYRRSGFFSLPAGVSVPAIYPTASANLTLPDEVTFSVRQVVNPQWTLLGTVEWQDWSRIGNVGIFANGTNLETLNLNYRDGWFFSVGAEYAYSPLLTLRGGVGYERSPVQDSTRDILLPDTDRIHVNIGATYKWSDRIAINAAYSHIFFEDNAPFCIANPASNGGTTHCTGAPTEQVLLQGSADVAVDLVSVSLNYQLSAPPVPLK